MPHHRRLLSEVPGYSEARSAIENLTLSLVSRRSKATVTAAVVPVVVHVLHYTSEQNISATQVSSQLEALNEAFTRSNADLDVVPEVWRPLIGDAGITFVMADRNPDGEPTDGITRTPATLPSFSDDDVMKDSALGGARAWPVDRYLNLWVCPLRDLLGYAQFPGGPAATDGVVIDYRAFGTTGTVDAPFDRGRTAVHEVGHWLNLFHIWGDDGTGCQGTDNVEDTPNQAGPNTGMPVFPHVTCDNGPDGDMFVNFMDYTDDPGMVMFTRGQVARMRATLSGPRASVVQQVSGGPGAPVTGWRHTDLTSAANAPAAAGDPTVLSSTDAVAVLYRGVDGHIHELRSDTSSATPPEERS